MQNSTGPQGHDGPRPTTFGTPEADIVVYAGDKDTGRRAAPLNTLTDGVPVIAAGWVDQIREHGSIEAPRATFVLVNDPGQATYAAAAADVLAEYSLFLMDGVPVSVHGIARQPFPEDPRTTYIQVLRVEPHFD